MIETQLEQIVEEFERAQRAGQSPEIAAYSARVPAAERADIVVELIRSDIEFRWENGLRSRDIETYRQEFPQVFVDSDRLRDIAFEDCRQRLRHGQAVDSKQYASRFGIDVSDWQFESSEPIASASVQGLPADNAYVRAIYDYFSDFIPVLELGRGAAGRVYLAAKANWQNDWLR